MNFLIIEDDVFLATKLKYLFDKRDATNIVTVVNNYLDFLDEISIIKIYDVILLDINLWDKVKSWYDVLKIIREKSSHIPVIIVSWIDDIMNMSKFFSLGASDYIIKPFRFEELEIRVLKWFKNNFLKLDNLNNNNIFYNWLLYDIDKNEFYFNWKNIVLTKKNKYLLYIFITNKEIFLPIYRFACVASNKIATLSCSSAFLWSFSTFSALPRSALAWTLLGSRCKMAFVSLTTSSNLPSS